MSYENLWDRFDGIATPEEVEQAKVQAEPLEAGNYQMKLTDIKADTNKDGLPMLKGVLELETGKKVYYNQMLQNLNYPQMTAVNIKDAVEFISGIIGVEVVFEGLGKLAVLIEQIVTGGDYIVEVSYGKKDAEMKFAKLKVIENLNEGKVMIDDSKVPF
jgi:hypothetical protein